MAIIVLCKGLKTEFGWWVFKKKNLKQAKNMVTAKFKCDNIIDNPEYQNKTVRFHAVYGDGLENKSFSKYTPVANLSMVISYDTLAVNFFEKGKEYYLDFRKAE